MEGPPVRLVAEELSKFVGMRVVSVSGNARTEKASVRGKEVVSVFNRGKNLFIAFPDRSVRVHFLMYGSYRINEEKVGRSPSLSLVFEEGVLNFYGCSVQVLPNSQVKALYDEEIDITSEKWNAGKVLRLSSQMKGEFVCDILLDQGVFAGVGNIIKNEGLFAAKLHPLSIVEKMPEEKMKEVISTTREFSDVFYQVLKRGESLSLYLKIYGKRKCYECGGRVVKRVTGKRRRISFFCPSCQKLHS